MTYPEPWTAEDLVSDISIEEERKLKSQIIHSVGSKSIQKLEERGLDRWAAAIAFRCKKWAEHGVHATRPTSWRLSRAEVKAIENPNTPTPDYLRLAESRR